MTPMQSLKNVFDMLNQKLPSVFKITALNKSESYTSYSSFCGQNFEHVNKGVRSDFIKTYKAKLNDKDSYSIGFSFSYLDKKPDEQTVQVSLKVGNKEPVFYKGNYLSVEQFRTMMLETINRIDSLEDKSYKPIVEIFKQDFTLLPSHPPKIKIASQRKKMKK